MVLQWKRMMIIGELAWLSETSKILRYENISKSKQIDKHNLTGHLGWLVSYIIFNFYNVLGGELGILDF
jgi:hypothetical protein